MWSLRRICCAFVLSLCAGLALGSDYRVAKGDEFNVFVLGEADLSVQVRINDEGTIFYPLLGELRVEGRTVPELEAFFTGLLKGDYLINPVVSVTMVSYREVYVQGEVRKPGAYPYQPGLTVRQLITEAGGIICPACPSFYSDPQNFEELAATVIDRVLDLAGFELKTYRWQEEGEE